MHFMWFCKDVDDDVEFILSNLTNEPLVSENDVATLPQNAVSILCLAFDRISVHTQSRSVLYSHHSV